MSDSMKRNSSRVKDACTTCRERKQKCDGKHPCSQCLSSGRTCEYTEVKPTKVDLSIAALHAKFSSLELLLTRLFQPMHRTIPVFENEDDGFRQRWLSNHWYLKKDNARGISALEGYKDLQADFGPYLLRLEHNRAPIASQLPCSAIPGNHLSKLLESYLGTIHILHPILAQPRIMFERFNRHLGRLANDSDVVLDDITISVENAIVLLMFALGEVCAYDGLLPDTQTSESFDDDPRIKAATILPGMAYFSRAVAMLAMMMGGYSLEHAQAMILAALFLNQIARPAESWSWITNACRIIEALIQHEFANITSLVNEDLSRIRDVSIVYWTCLQLEGETLICLRTLPLSHLTTFRRNMMIISMRVPYQDRFLWKRFFFNILISETFLQPYDILHQRKRVRPWNYNMNDYINTKRFWLNKMDADEEFLDEMSRPTDLGLASLRLRFYSVFSRVLYPSLYDACHDQHFLSSIDENLPGQDRIIEAICDCIDYTLQSIIVFDRFEPAHRFVFSKAVSILHGHFEGVLVLHEFYTSRLYPKLAAATRLTEVKLQDILTRTMYNLSCSKNASPILKIDHEILYNIQQQLRAEGSG